MYRDRTWSVIWSFQETWNMMLYDRWPCRAKSRAKSISNPPHWVGVHVSGPWQYILRIRIYSVCLGAPATHPHILIINYSKPKKCNCKWELSPRSKHPGLKNESQKHLQATAFSKNTPKKTPQSTTALFYRVWEKSGQTCRTNYSNK